MTNEKKYFGELTEYGRECIVELNGVDKNTTKPNHCRYLRCGNCLFFDPPNPCKKHFREWLKQEYKEPIVLTEFEREILKMALEAEYQYIARDKSNKLFAYKQKPQKESCTWTGGRSGYMYDLNLFKNDFQFIKWEDNEPYSIEELLKGE